jgi:protein disulfide-isomerase A6
MKYLAFLICLSLLSFVNLTAINLDTDNYNQEVSNSGDVWLIEYFSKRCGTCQEFEPIWKNVVSKLENIKIGRVDIDEIKGMKLAQKLNILEEGIPNVKMIFKGKQTTIMTGMDDKLKNEQELAQSIKKVLNSYQNTEL